MHAVAVVVLGLAALPAVMIAINLAAYRRAPRRRRGSPEPRALSGGVSVIVPARDEARSIGAAVASALADPRPDLEVVVVDDASTDATADIVREIARRDRRVRLEPAPALPEGWNGKQHACAHGARAARHDLLVFVDADVRLAPDAIARIGTFLDRRGADLASGVPRQRTGTWAERLLIPLIHLVLLGYLPIPLMRRIGHPAFAAGCGQLFVARRRAYEAAGGHAAIRGSRHDGVTLPRAFRRAGLRTDLFDATDLATCRMYRSATEVGRGLSKNADEGMATPAGIGPWAVLLIGGHVAPFAVLAAALVTGADAAVLRPAVAATALAWTARFVLAGRFKQSVWGAALHPVGVAALVAIQVVALARSTAGRPVAWKGRVRS